jgi:tryptophanyl-tRNA synthetase
MVLAILTVPIEGSMVARVFSGIQPTETPHIGNDIGAIRRWVAAQDDVDGFYCIVDMHAITVPQDPETLRAKTLDLAAILLAAGIDPQRSTLFVQSHVHEHAEGAWVLFCFTTFGELRRMTQFKDKSQKQQEGFVSAGLFNYPVLQAADVLLYQADRVPVGEDQRQHLELMRDVAIRFNQRFGETFVVPEAAIAKVGAKIMDLQNPEMKMSKSSDSPQGTVAMTDPPDVIRKKLKTAVTDSGREVKASEDKPAITNLLTIFSVASGRTVEDLENEYGDEGYARFKTDLADALIEYLRPFQERHAEISADPGEIQRLLKVGADKAQAVSAPTLATVYERVGFLPRA